MNLLLVTGDFIYSFSSSNSSPSAYSYSLFYFIFSSSSFIFSFSSSKRRQITNLCTQFGFVNFWEKRAARFYFVQFSLCNNISILYMKASIEAGYTNHVDAIICLIVKTLRTASSFESTFDFESHCEILKDPNPSSCVCVCVRAYVYVCLCTHTCSVPALQLLRALLLLLGCWLLLEVEPLKGVWRLR